MSNPNSITDDLCGDLYLGIDVGGTDVKIGLVDSLGQIRDRHRTATPALGTPQRVLQYAVEYAENKLRDPGLQSANLKAAGLAVPGVLDTTEFVLREIVNLPGWLGVPLQQELAAASKLPSVVVNDANSAAFAEHSLRDLGQQSLALLTLGTGVGCGVVFRGDPHGGDHGCAGELGHIAIDFSPDALECTCGSRGHLESYAGARGVVKRMKTAMQMAKEVDQELLSESVTPKEIAAAAAAGNRVCQEVILETGRFVGRAIGMIGQVADPAVVLLGGAMTFGAMDTHVGREFLQSVRDSVKETTLAQVGGNISIEFATLGNDAGMLGAAMLAKQAVI